MKILKRFLKVVSFSFLALIFLFLGILVYFNVLRLNDLRIQRNHLSNLRTIYNEDYVGVNEQNFVGFDLTDETIRFNEIQMLASHNSYKLDIPFLGQVFVALGENLEEALALSYAYPSLTEQFNLGIRSIELDVRYRRNQYEVVHVPLVDNRSNATNLALALEEVMLWSSNHENHIPIVILIEMKDDWMMLDPFLKEYNEARLLELNTLVEETFQERLFRPSDLLHDSRTLKQTLAEDNWPYLIDMLGKVIVVMHPSATTENYVFLDESLQSLSMFPGSYTDEADYASFIVHNTPNIEMIQAFVDQNLIVRTRLDENLIISETRLNQGYDSGAQILTTDYIPGHLFTNTEYTAILNEPFTIIKNKYLHD